MFREYGLGLRETELPLGPRETELPSQKRKPTPEKDLEQVSHWIRASPVLVCTERLWHHQVRTSTGLGFRAYIGPVFVNLNKRSWKSTSSAAGTCAPKSPDLPSMCATPSRNTSSIPL